MSFYIILYLLVIFTFFVLGVSVYKKYQDLSGYYFLVFAVSWSIRLLLYFVSYFVFRDPQQLLIISKLWYFLSLGCFYGFALFVYYFDSANKNYFSLQNKIIHILALAVFWIYVFSDGIIWWMYLDTQKNDYYEIQWSIYFLHILLNICFFLFFMYTAFKKYRSINYLNKLRLKYILFWVFLLIILTIFFQLLLPLFDIWILEREVWLFFIPFIILTFYSIHRYNLSNIKIKIWEVIVVFQSLLLTIFFINIARYYAGIFGTNFQNFWWVNSQFWIIDISVWILLFSIIHKFLNKILLGTNTNSHLMNFIIQLKKEIPHITNLGDLNNHLEVEFQKTLKLKHVKIKLFTDKKSQLFTYFSQKSRLNLFINDVVFIQENKHKFNEALILKEIPKKSYLIFPMYDNKNKVVGYFSVGKKPFEDHYYSEEIAILKDFKIFLEWHIKYLDIYKKIHELSVNLDKQVDKQTIEYNQLINKQKEFINVISHEVKGPIASSIFQIDSIIDDFKDDALDKKSMQEELDILNGLLLKTGDLVNKLFSIQQFEMNSKSLFKEDIKILKLLQNEISIFQKIHPDITFHSDFDESIKYISLDKVQFRQVIDNLINNALKIIDPQKWEIYISCKPKGDMIEIIIEDNGIWFSQLEINNIFEKYSTGKWTYIGLGMGLYLCRTIVELHSGNIQASFWKKLWWACIIINIPR